MKALKTATLRHFHKNPRRGNVQAVADSLEAFGQFKPIIVNRGTQTGREWEVLAGNHTLKAARQLGWKEIQAEIVDVDEDTAARIVVADNRTADRAAYDKDLLAGILTELEDMSGTGYTGDDIQDLLIEAQTATGAPSTDGPAEEGTDGENRWEQASRRSIIIEYPVAQFAWVVEKLYELAQARKTSSNAATARNLLEEYTHE